MSQAKRLARLEEHRAAEERSRSLPLSIQWQTPEGVQELGPSDGRTPAMTMHLTRSTVPAPAPLDDEPEPVAPAPSMPRGQRPRRASEAEQEAALDVLRDRARRGLYVGELPASEAEMAAEQARRLADTKHARMLVATSRSEPERSRVLGVGFSPFRSWSRT